MATTATAMATTATGITRGAMAMADAKSRGLAVEARRVAVVLVVTMVLWMAVQAIGGEMGWPPRLALLADLAAAAGFVWALARAFQIWRASRA